MAIGTKIKLGREVTYVLKDLDKAGEIAMFYGFQSVKTPKIEKADLDQAKSLVADYAEHPKITFPRPEEKFSLLRTIIDWELHNEANPLMLHYRRPISQFSTKRATDDRHHSLDIVGSQGSISEAIAIRTAVAILAEHGQKNVIVDINSIGDKYSVAQFEKELINFTRKHGSNAPAEVKQQIKKDPFDVWRCDHEQWLDIRKRAPQSLSFLSEQSVNHFQEVLEHLETLDIPYRINPSLIGHKHFCSHTIFEIKSAPQNGPEQPNTTQIAEETFAIGTRHNYLARRVGFKRDTPVMSVNLRFKKPTIEPKLIFKKKPQPQFFFIQFGSAAKLKSLPIIESLRQARIPVHHMLTSDRFLDQLTSAEKQKSPYVIILGQKEALENTVVVREMSNRSQDIVPIQNLAQYLAKI